MGMDNANYYRLLLEDTAGSGTYTAVAFLQGTEITRGNAAIDVTNKTDGPDQTWIAGGLKSFTISANGIASDDASYDKIHDIIEACPNSWNVQVEWLDGCDGSTVRKTATCLAFLTERTEGGAINEALAFSITLNSSGTVTFA